MTEIAPLDRSHLPQVLELVNGHLGAVIPGWSLTADYLWGRLQREPQESVTDPWVVERRSIVGIVRDRVCAAAHLRRYGEETPWKGTGYIAWTLFWPEEREAGVAVMTACRRQMKAWQVSEERVGSLPVPTCVGTPDAWPHVIALMKQSGYSANEETDESVYGGTLRGISAPGEPPARGVTIHRSAGEFGTRFVARLDGEEIAECECIPDLTEGGQLPALAGWAELSEVGTRESMRNQGIGSWVVRHAVEWLRLAKCDRIVVPVARDDEQAGAGRFYRRFGWMPLVRQRHWRRQAEG